MFIDYWRQGLQGGTFRKEKTSFRRYYCLALLCFLSCLGLAQDAIPLGLHELKQDTLHSSTGEKIPMETGRLGIPEDRKQPSGRIISIAYHRFLTTHPHPAPPVFMLAGGPGSSWISSLHQEERFREVQFYQANSDVIVLDQRGMGRSIPNLVCEGRERVLSNAPFSYELLGPALQKLAEECQGKWAAEGVDLSAYNTDENAADVDALREALGYKKIILLGGSYGSHLGLHMLRRFPDHIDRAIFYGVEGPDHTWDHPTGRWRTLGRIAASAEASAYYKDKLPPGGLLQAFLEVLERVERKPPLVSLERNGQQFEVLVTKDAVQAVASFRAGRRSQPETWPDAILAMYQGDYRLPAMAVMGMRSIPAPHAMAKSMDFASGRSAAKRAQLAQDSARAYLGDINWDYNLLEGHWNVNDLGEAFRTNIRSDIPTLLVHGTWDTSTPLDNAQEVLAGLANGHLIAVKGGGHGALYNLYENWPAIFSLLQDFVRGKEVHFPDVVELDPVSYPKPGGGPVQQLWDGAKAGDLARVREAIAAGADLEALDTRRSKTGRRALNWAAYYNHQEVLAYLIEAGADLNARNRSGFTALHHAVENRAVEAAQLLLKAGADKSISNRRGQRPVDMALQLGHRKLLKLLEE